MELSHPTVFLFGAGATRGAFSNRSAPPPLDGDFFEIAGQIRGHGTSRLASTVLNDVLTLYGRIIGVGLENYYRDIEARAIVSRFAKSANKPRDWARRQRNLEELIRRIVIHTTRDQDAKQFTPGKSDIHSRILSNLAPRDTIITFNYDLLIEESFPNEHLWTPRGGYGEGFHGITSGWCKKWFENRKASMEAASKIQLLKLHGSINWTLYKTGEVRLKPRPFVARTRGGAPVFEDVSILPPGWNKQINKNPYKQFWREARLKLENCDSVVVLGYSLPEADLLAQALLSEVVRMRAARKRFLEQLHLADPSESVKQKFVDLFIPVLNARTKVARYGNIEDFAEKCKVKLTIPR